MFFIKTSKKVISSLLAGCLAFSVLIPSITPASASEISYSVMISPQFEQADRFSEGLAAVKKDGKWGYIDETGKTIIPFEYDYAYQFSEGLAIVAVYSEENQYYNWYVIDRENNAKILGYPARDGIEAEPIYLSVDPSDYSHRLIYHNGYVNMNGFLDEGVPNMIFDRNGNMVNFFESQSGENYFMIDEEFNEGYWAATSFGYGYFVDESTHNIIKIANGSNVIDIRPLNQGLAIYGVGDYDNSLWGFVDKTGKTVIEPQYTNFYVSDTYASYIIFNDNIASVKNQNGLWGGIDKTGKTVIPFEYELLKTFHEGLAVAQKNGKYGIIDTNNNIILPFEYDNLSGYNNGMCIAVKDGLAFCIDRYGNKINGSDKINQETYFPNGLDDTETIRPDDIIVIKENGLYGYAKLIFTPDLPQQSEMDSWAYDEVVKSIESNLVPVSLQNQYKTNITREDFAALVVKLLEQASGKDIDTLVKEETEKTITELVTNYTFKDTSNYDVIAANALGIISGRGNGIFDPYSSITRQEAAALLMRIGKYMGKTNVETSSASFTDSSAIQSYAVEAVNYVNSLNVMKGTSDTTFSPNGTYTRQQAYITALRLFNAITE